MARMYSVQLTSSSVIKCESIHPSTDDNNNNNIDTQSQQELVDRYFSQIQTEHPDETLNVTLKPLRQCNVKFETQADPGVTHTTAFHLAQAFVTRFLGEYYTFMMSHEVVSKTDNYVGWTVNPVSDVVMYNAGLMGDRNIAAAAGNWKLDIVLGPFPCKEQARNCGLNWVDGTRGKFPKRKKAPWLSEEYNVNMYDARCSPMESVSEFMQRETLPVFSDAYNTAIL